jgi:hypothetical protein
VLAGAAERVENVALAEDHDMDQQGERRQCRYRLACA